MLKRFFISFMGAIAGFWVSIMLAGVALFILIGAGIAAGLSSSSGPKVESRSILYINLDGIIEDRVTPSGLLDEIKSVGKKEDTQALNDIVNALNAAAGDDKIKGVFIDCNGATCGLANAQALVNAIDRFRESKKWVIAYGDSYTQTNYMIASHSDSLLINPIGSVDIHGLGSITPFYKGLMDKLGIEMQVTKVGTYKSAVEPYILNSMSEPAREQQQLYLDNMWKQVKKVIAEGRNIPADTLDRYADDFIFTLQAEDLLKMKVVDGIRYRHQVEETLCELSDVKKRDDLRLVTPAEYCAAEDIFKGKDLMNVAVLYAVGDIVDDGEGGIVGSTYVDEIFKISEDDDIDALILRVNSPGGSGFASEQIWEALEQFKATTGKPYYVSMSDYAASGGYYISCGADRIYAEALTLTGSIGVFGMIPNISGLLNDKLGVNTSIVETNPNSTFPTILRPMTPQQKVALQRSIDIFYELFVGRVAKGRKMEVAKVKEIAEGRVWDGATALKLGLVDRLGGLDMALADMAEQLGVSPSKIRVTEYPEVESKWWKEIIDISKAKVKMWFIDDELDGENLMIYKAIQAVKGMNPLQARMEYVIVE